MCWLSRTPPHPNLFTFGTALQSYANAAKAGAAVWYGRQMVNFAPSNYDAATFIAQANAAVSGISSGLITTGAIIAGGMCARGVPLRGDVLPSPPLRDRWLFPATDFSLAGGAGTSLSGISGRYRIPVQSALTTGVGARLRPQACSGITGATGFGTSALTISIGGAVTSSTGFGLTPQDSATGGGAPESSRLKPLSSLIADVAEQCATTQRAANTAPAAANVPPSPPMTSWGQVTE